MNMKVQIPLFCKIQHFLTYWIIFFSISRYYLTIVDEFFRQIFLTNFFDKLFSFLTYNLLTIASFKIGVPSIFFLKKTGDRNLAQFWACKKLRYIKYHVIREPRWRRCACISRFRKDISTSALWNNLFCQKSTFRWQCLSVLQ